MPCRRSITNLYVTPVSRIEFLLGKQLPYIAVAMTNFALMLMIALFVFQVPLKGSFPTLLLGALIPMTYFVPISVGTFTKGLVFSDLVPNLAALAVFIPVLTLVNVLLLRKQER